MPVVKGFDTTANCTSLAGRIKSAGFGIIFRYLGQSDWKIIHRAEADALLAAGVAIGLIYEDAPTQPGYFTPDRGERDALRAAQQAVMLGAPAGTGISFTVDYDASPDDIRDRIVPYFRAVKATLARQPISFLVGAYGSVGSYSCVIGEGLANYGFRSCSHGWLMYRDGDLGQAYPPAIDQSTPAAEPDLGLVVDIDHVLVDLSTIGAIMPWPEHDPA